jgi:acetate kinase
MRQSQVTGDQLDELLNQRSGLLGISGVSGDMREVLAAIKAGNQRAKLAFDIYTHRLRAGVGAMIAVLGGIDALVFTAGVGENSPDLRAAVCQNLGYAGIELDVKKNAESPKDQDISVTGSPARVMVIRAQEDWEIARDCWKLMIGTAGDYRVSGRLAGEDDEGSHHSEQDEYGKNPAHLHEEHE